MQLIGWTAVVENVVTSIVDTTTTQESTVGKLTIEKIIFNKVGVLNVNFFDYTEAGEENDVIYQVKNLVVSGYNAIRNLAIAGLLVTLIYIGLRMAFATIGEQKAKYSELLINWLVSFIILFSIHYIMLGIILLNESIVKSLNDGMITTETINTTVLRKVEKEDGTWSLEKFNVTEEVTVENSIYESILEKAYDMKALQGMTGTVLYMFLVYYLVKFLFIYAKRLLTIYILAITSPLIAISYAIDKIKDNKSQGLARWLGEFSKNVLLQSIHALLYSIFIQIVFEMAFNTEFIGIVIALVFLNFMLKAESLLFSMFKFGGKGSSIKSITDSTAEAEIAIAATWGIGKKGYKLGKAGVEKGIGAYKNFREKHEPKDLTELQKQEKQANIESKNAKKVQRQANWNFLRGTVSNSAKLMFSIPQMVANPKKGISEFASSVIKLKKTYGVDKRVKLTRKKGIKGIGDYIGRGVLAIATGGVGLGLLNRAQANRLLDKEIDKADNKTRILEAARQAETRAIESLKNIPGPIEKQYRSIIKDGGKIRTIALAPSRIKTTIEEAVRDRDPKKIAAETISSISLNLRDLMAEAGITIDETDLEKNITEELTDMVLATVISRTNEIETEINSNLQKQIGTFMEDSSRGLTGEEIVRRLERGESISLSIIEIERILKEDHIALSSDATRALEEKRIQETRRVEGATQKSRSSEELLAQKQVEEATLKEIITVTDSISEEQKRMILDIIKHNPSDITYVKFEKILGKEKARQILRSTVRKLIPDEAEYSRSSPITRIRLAEDFTENEEEESRMRDELTNIIFAAVNVRDGLPRRNTRENLEEIIETLVEDRSQELMGDEIARRLEKGEDIALSADEIERRIKDSNIDLSSNAQRNFETIKKKRTKTTSKLRLERQTIKGLVSFGRDISEEDREKILEMIDKNPERIDSAEFEKILGKTKKDQLIREVLHRFSSKDLQDMLLGSTRRIWSVDELPEEYREAAEEIERIYKANEEAERLYGYRLYDAEKIAEQILKSVKK